MKCRDHPYNSGVGVCPLCLTERLLALIAAQNELAAGDPTRRRSDPPLLMTTTLDFPHSVSPYVAGRRSDASAAGPIRRFFRTPQIGPGSDAGPKKRFSLLSAIFGRRGSGEDAARSWLSAIFGRRPARSRPLSFGMREEECGMSPAAEGESRRPPSTPARWTAAAGRGFAVCLSPMVRAHPRGGPGDLGLPRELRAFPSLLKARHGPGPALGPNRSRKLADMGKVK